MPDRNRNAPQLATLWATLRSPPATASLPQRVKDIIQEQDRRSEVLIGWVQVGIATTLWCLYLLAPRPADAVMTMFAPVPFALAGFTAFSLFRLWLIRRSRVPGWFVALSIFADIGLLLALVWSFHLQYHQPPGFSLKAPTFVYLFVFIVLRTLRFDPRYVLAAGLAAAAGWASLTALIVSMSGGDAITRSFTEYVGSSHILIGAEFDKVFAILLVTALLTLAARQAQLTLVSAVREEAALGEVSRFLSRGVAERIARSETLVMAGDAAERDAAILMLDIRGFTPYAASAPVTEVVRTLTSFHARIVPIIRSNGGVVDKFLGDGVMITFGAVDPSSTAARDALTSLDLILDEAMAWEASLASMGVGRSLTINAGAAAGPVVFTALGGGERLEYTVIGEAVNLAAKLEKHNKALGSRALVSGAMLEMAEAQGYQGAAAYVDRSGVLVGGVAGPLDLYARMM